MSNYPSQEMLPLSMPARLLKWRRQQKYPPWRDTVSMPTLSLFSLPFNGYLLGVVLYYSGANEDQPAAIRQLKLGYSNDEADWGGNFAGDFMWTVEPIVILLSPFIISRLTKSKGDKVKKD
mmetsp:Transcript_18397/g.27945  ORF Transcript_18397/g.27945 Transcript_18397/m.27945 type:complete len:121 (+) Transcript_18397:881-1243(+)